jgi:2-polyprenyl-3-methyl-5-hydroxy-6-metoxy-1,4-benzoquinol methylase
VQMPKEADYYAHERVDLLDWVGGQFERVLDIGCGAGSNAPWFRRHGAREIVGVELDDPSAARAKTVFDQVVQGTIEEAIVGLDGSFDLIVCADVLEHLVDPWAIVDQLRRLTSPSTVLAVSIPNIRFLGALARIAVGPGFQYQEQGIFDVTHMRFFTRHDVDRMLHQGGWMAERWGSQLFGRFQSARVLAQRLTRGRSDQWLAEQLFVVARPVRAPNSR